MHRIRAAFSTALLLLSMSLLPLAGCGPGVSWHARLGAGDTTPEIALGGDAPLISGVRLSREGHDLAVRLALAPDAATPRPALTGASSGRDGWTFQLAFDTDHERGTGDATGAEWAAVVDARGDATLLAWSKAGWRRVASAPIDERLDGISFRLDATRLPAALESAALTAESYRVAVDAGGGTDVAPLGSMRFDGDPSPVPAMTRLRCEVRGDTLYLRGQFSVSEHGDFYGPARPGGWMLQLLLDTGQDGVGYWRGYDYIVRGGEWSGGRFTVRRITLDDSTPGGWGPASGHARFRLLPRHFELAIPLDALGGDDGRADFALETYLTVACPDCPGGVSAVGVGDYLGRSGSGGVHRGGIHLVAGLDAERLGIAPSPSSGADAR